MRIISIALRLFRLSHTDLSTRLHSYTLVRRIGYAPTASSTVSKAAVYLHYSASRRDHFTSASATPPSTYVSLGVQGYLLNSSAPPKVLLSFA